MEGKANSSSRPKIVDTATDWRQIRKQSNRRTVRQRQSTVTASGRLKKR